VPSTAADIRHTTPRASARMAEVGPSGAPRLSCLLEDLESGANRVALNGELDVATAPKADRALRGAQACAQVVIVDLRRLEFIGATAARVLLAADARARRTGGRLVVVPTPKPVHRTPELAQLYRRLETTEQRLGEQRQEGAEA